MDDQVDFGDWHLHYKEIRGFETVDNFQPYLSAHWVVRFHQNPFLTVIGEVANCAPYNENIKPKLGMDTSMQLNGFPDICEPTVVVSHLTEFHAPNSF